MGSTAPSLAILLGQDQHPDGKFSALFALLEGLGSTYMRAQSVCHCNERDFLWLQAWQASNPRIAAAQH
jgi:hypothetical protein